MPKLPTREKATQWPAFALLCRTISSGSIANAFETSDLFREQLANEMFRDVARTLDLEVRVDAPGVSVQVDGSDLVITGAIRPGKR